MTVQEPMNPQISDIGLVMLVDFCKKTIATVGGDGHSEIVLYRNNDTGEYTLHTYEMHQPATAELHRAFRTTEDAAKQIFTLIEKENLAASEGIRDSGMCGGEIVCKFNRGGLQGANKDSTMIRITSTMGNVHPVGNLMYSLLAPENEIGLQKTHAEVTSILCF